MTAICAEHGTAIAMSAVAMNRSRLLPRMRVRQRPHRHAAQAEDQRDDRAAVESHRRERAVGERGDPRQVAGVLEQREQQVEAGDQRQDHAEQRRRRHRQHAELARAGSRTSREPGANTRADEPLHERHVVAAP